jgi:hypothetical protein
MEYLHDIDTWILHISMTLGNILLPNFGTNYMQQTCRVLTQHMQFQWTKYQPTTTITIAPFIYIENDHTTRSTGRNAHIRKLEANFKHFFIQQQSYVDMILEETVRSGIFTTMRIPCKTQFYWWPCELSKTIYSPYNLEETIRSGIFTTMRIPCTTQFYWWPCELSFTVQHCQDSEYILYQQQRHERSLHSFVSRW